MSYPFTSPFNGAGSKEQSEDQQRHSGILGDFRGFVNRLNSNSQLAHFVIISKMHLTLFFHLNTKRINSQAVNCTIRLEVDVWAGYD